MAFVANGTTFSLNNEVIAELRKIDGPSIKRDDIDTTNHDGTYWKEFLPGLVEGGEIDCEGNYVPSDLGILEIIDAVTTDTVLSTWEITFPNGYGFSGTGTVTSFKPTGPYDDKSEVSFTVKTSGAITFETPS